MGRVEILGVALVVGSLFHVPASSAAEGPVQESRFRQIYEIRDGELSAPASKDYVPLHPGDQWIYQASAPQPGFTLKVVSKETLRGVEVWKLVRKRPGSPDDFDLLSADDVSGVRLHRRQSQGSIMDMDPAVRFCGPLLVVGATLTTEPSQVNPATGHTTLWTSRVDLFEDVQVPAGTFPCVKFRLLVRDSKLGTKLADVELWYGKNVGLVKRQGQFFGVYFQDRLQEFHPGPGIR